MGIIDILSSILGVGDGRVYHVISLKDLIAAKEGMGREKDLLAAKELRAIAAERKRQRDA